MTKVKAKKSVPTKKSKINGNRKTSKPCSSPGKFKSSKKKSFSKRKKREDPDDYDDIDSGDEEQMGMEDDQEELEVVSNKFSNKKSEHNEEYEENFEDELASTRDQVKTQNRKKKKSGGFQSMGLSSNVFKGIQRKGYKIPTPIQRKTIPIIMNGKDVVAMARTGSGKTAAFLIPMFEHLKIHSSNGARAMIMSPTRELALQTLKFTKEIGKQTDLRAAVILGGDRMEQQFSALHENPDIIIATPGRFLHVTMEMNLKLKSMEYVVFDEADRLFEMGFQEQLHEIIHRLPDSRQTLLFSATLPKQLVEFAKAGLSDPTLIRLDVDNKLSEHLKTVYLSCRSEDKPALLVNLLQNIIPNREQAFVFAATKHHVEYLNLILEKAGISCSYIYSSLDPTARKIAVGKFQMKKVRVMIVTDLAARGIDIPMLDNVINYNFPAKAKLFVHRVGRVARAGRTGTAFSIISPDDVQYLIDLHVFLGHPLNLVTPGAKYDDDNGLYGTYPANFLESDIQTLQQWHSESHDMTEMKRVCSNAYKQYQRSRPNPAAESVKRVKQMENEGVILGVHPIYLSKVDDGDEAQQKLLNALKKYKSRSTVFEISNTAKTKSSDIMREKRAKHQTVISSNNKRSEQSVDESSRRKTKNTHSEENETNADQIQSVFSTVIDGRASTKYNDPSRKKKKREKLGRDEENYLSYQPADYQTEKGFSLGGFDREVAGAEIEIVGDDVDTIRNQRSQSKWDRKRKRYVKDGGSNDPTKKKIRTESGAWIPASYKSSVYPLKICMIVSWTCISHSYPGQSD
ncbi:hypothetical protein SNE40_007642 [Patella caerulea]|uniref:RNA helicase n=1 Tax=Patella caerulea TaxID=87958 RepID=A0AAN8PVB1_PATCE